MAVFTSSESQAVDVAALAERLDAALTRIADLEVAASRRALEDELIAERLANHDAILHRIVNGAEPLANANEDLHRRQRALLVELAGVSNLGISYRGAKRVANILAGHCLTPAGAEGIVERLHALYHEPPSQRTVWRRLKEYRDISRY